MDEKENSPQSTVRLPNAVREDFVLYMERGWKRGLKWEKGEVLTAALMAFWSLDELEQDDLIQRARNYDYERLRVAESKAELGEGGAADARAAHEKALRQSAQRKPRQHQSGSG